MPKMPKIGPLLLQTIGLIALLLFLIDPHFRTAAIDTAKYQLDALKEVSPSVEVRRR
jgi:hypothetical protein